MARIRTIKPAFFKNEQLAELSFAHRLLFAGLWTQADREGRMEDRPRRLKAEVFPYDDVDVSSMLQDMATGPDPLLVRYEVDGKGYLWIRKFSDHQRPHYSEPPSVYPTPPEGLTRTAETSAALVGEVVPATLGREGKGKEGNGGGKEAPAPPFVPSRGSLVGHHQTKCDPATWDACARGVCVPNFLVAEWRSQIEHAGGNTHEEIKQLVGYALAHAPSNIGNPLKFWRGVWESQHGTPTLHGERDKTKAERSIDAFDRAGERLEEIENRRNETAKGSTQVARRGSTH